MSGHDLVRVSRIVPASADRVFGAWTNADQVKRWWGGAVEGFEVTDVKMDARPGGRYRIEYTGLGLTAVLVGTYREVTPPSRLVFTFGWEEALIDPLDIGETFVTVELREIDEGTEVVILHERLRDVETVLGFYETGWNNGLDRLEGFLQ